MTYQVLARKWRPRNFDELVGQEHVVRALRNALDADRVHHAFLFTGTRGVGKTTLARILAKSLNCETGMSSTPCGECSTCVEVDQGRFVDLIEVDAASRAKVDQTRDLMDNVQFAPTRGRHKVYLIDEVHMFSTASFNALLKTLEEPPPHVKFLLATTDPQKVPVTVLSRCLQFNLKRLPAVHIAAHLNHILSAEGMENDPGASALIARAADGSMRDALSLLDQAIAYGGGRLVLEDVQAMLGTVDRQHVRHLLEALLARDADGLLQAAATLRDDGVDADEALESLARALQRVAVTQVAPGSVDESDELDVLALELHSRFDPADVQLYYQVAIMGRRDLTLAPDPALGLEMALLRMLAFSPQVSGGNGAAPPAGGSGPPVRPANRPPDSGGPARAPEGTITPSASAGRGGSAATDGRALTPAQAAREAAGLGRTRGAQNTGRPSRPAIDASPSGHNPSGEPATREDARPAAAAPSEERSPAPGPESDRVLGERAEPVRPAPLEAGPAPGDAAEPPARPPSSASSGRDVEAAAPDAGAALQGDAGPAKPLPARPLPALAGWPAWINELELAGLPGELAANAQLLAVDGDVLKVRIAPAKRQLASDSLLQQLGQTLGAVTGRALRLELELGEIDAETPADLARRQAAERHAAAVAAISADPGVQAICEAFDAAVDPQLVKALD